jgi:ribose transport system permease protein
MIMKHIPETDQNTESLKNERVGSWLAKYDRELNLLTMIFAATVVFGILYPRSFLSTQNISSILNYLTSEGMIAIGMMLLMIGGAFDLSVGSMYSMAGIFAGYFMIVVGLPPSLAVVLAIMCAGLGGAINGLLVARVKVNPMITTLGTLGIFKGIAVLIGGPGISGLPASFTWFGQTTFLGVQLPFWLMLGMAVLGHYLTHYTWHFRQYYFIGSNERAAKLSGIDVETLQLRGFIIMGIIAGIAGIAFASRVGTAVSTAGDQMELRVITAVVLGGASLQGGKGTIPGAIIGVVFMAIVGNLLITTRVSSYWHSIVVGAILIAAVAHDSLQNKKRTS